MRLLAWLSVAILIAGSATAAALSWGQGRFAGNPAAIKEGMTADAVRAVAGFPASIGSVRWERVNMRAGSRSSSPTAALPS